MKAALTLGLWLMVAGASAQEPVVFNPTTVEIQGTYTEAEWASITGFRLMFYALPATADGLGCQVNAPLPTQPVQVVALAKPLTWAGGVGTTPLPARPFGCYRATVMAEAAGLVSEASPQSNPFAVKPGAPSAVVR